MVKKFVVKRNNFKTYIRLHVVEGKPHYLGIEKMPEGTIKPFDFKLNLE